MTGDDRLTVERLVHGDAAALETIMAKYSGPVYRLAYGITRNTADAEEVAQDVFMTVFRKVGGFEARSTLGTWIYRVTANAALNKRRGKRHEVEVSIEDQLPAFRPDGHRAGDTVFLVADWSRTPDEELVATDRRAVLARALDALPEPYRAVVVLRDVEELSTEEVAEILGESVGAVKSRLHRARMALREHLTRATSSADRGVT